MKAMIRTQAVAAGKKLGLAGVALSLFVNQAMAAVPVAISTAVDDMKADGVTIATMIVVAFFTVFAIKFLWRAK